VRRSPAGCPLPHPFGRGVSRDLAAIVYQWPEPHTRAARINIIISKSKAGGPRPVSVLLSFSLPSPSLRASRGTHSSSASFRSSLFRPSIARSVSLCRIRRSARWMGTRLSPSALPFLLRAARARVASTHTRARCVRATATYLEADRASSTEGRRGSIARGSSTITEEGDREGGRLASTRRTDSPLRPSPLQPRDSLIEARSTELAMRLPHSALSIRECPSLDERANDKRRARREPRVSIIREIGLLRPRRRPNRNSRSPLV